MATPPKNYDVCEATTFWIDSCYMYGIYQTIEQKRPKLE